MNDGTIEVTIEEFVGLKKKIYLFLVYDRSNHKRAKVFSRNVVATISYNEYKDVLLNNQCLRHLMINTRSKDGRIENYKINIISLSCFVAKIYI